MPGYPVREPVSGKHGTPTFARRFPRVHPGSRLGGGEAAGADGTLVPWRAVTRFRRRSTPSCTNCRVPDKKCGWEIKLKNMKGITVVVLG